MRAEQAFVDRGYRGSRPSVPDVDEFISGQRRLTRWMRMWLKRRQAVEPIIGHLKHDHRMDRNYLSGWDGDRTNAILTGCGFNMAKLLRAIALLRSILGTAFKLNEKNRALLTALLGAKPA